ncbi:MAG: LytTR family DNA-binding domain-containing protein [Bacteroidia bacterium]|nr:LytTR family DNA-binding domain-containing protein [Bacteroidia bacterium]
MIHAIALDDELPALKVIENYCLRVDFITLEKTFLNPIEAQNFLQQSSVDLLFLDIHMPSLSGIEFYASLPQPIMVIFTTAHSQYALEGFNLNAIDYLLKPFSYERFLQAVNKAQDFYQILQNKEQAEKSVIQIRADYSLFSLRVEQILYVEGLDDYLRIYVQQNKPIITRMPLREMMEKLPAEQFMRVHRSYIVALNKIERVRNKIIYMGEKQIPVGRSYKDDFFNRFQR